MTVKLLIKQHLEFLSLKGGCTGSSGSALVKIPHGWKSCVTAHMVFSADPVGVHVISALSCEPSYGF